MGFLDETYEKARKAYKTAEKTTTSVVTVQKLKIKALKTDSELRELYAALGKSYYKQLLRDGNIPEDLAETVEAVRAKREELEAVKEKIVAEKGGVVCLSCGALNLDGSRYCHKCGKEI